jgi:hypothetical protein
MQMEATKIAFWKSAWTLRIAVAAKSPARLQQAFCRNAHIAASSSTTKRLPTPNDRNESP